MKLHEILEPQSLDERQVLKKAATIAALAAAAHGVQHLPHEKRTVVTPLHPQVQVMSTPAAEELPKLTPEQEKLVDTITQKFNEADPELVADVVHLAHKYEHETFPKAKDILAVVAVESSFKPNAKSGLKRDPALGLMQIRPGVWDVDPEEVKDVENNIKLGASILADYYKRFRDKRKALMAYNAGPDGMKESDYAPVYASKVERERMRLASR